MSTPVVLLCARDGWLAAKVLSGAMADGQRVSMSQTVVPEVEAAEMLAAIADEWGPAGARWAFPSIADLGAVRALGQVGEDGAILGTRGATIPRLSRSIPPAEVSRPDWLAAAVVVEAMAEAIQIAAVERARTRQLAA